MSEFFLKQNTRSLIGPCFSAAVALFCLGFRAKEAIEAMEVMVIYCAAYAWG